MNFFCNYAPGTYFVQLNVKTSVGDQAHHVLSVYVMKQWTRSKLPSEIVSIITDSSRIMGHVKKIDVDEAVKQ